MSSLLVAGAGGHLEELWILRPRLRGISDQVTWVTPDTPQSRSLLGDEPRFTIPKCEPRDVRGTLVTTHHAVDILRRRRWREIVSTGSIPAIPFFAVARAMGIPCHFIESAARVSDLSLTAKIVERLPGVHRYGQYEWWQRERWNYRGSVFDGFAAGRQPARQIQKVVVTLGASGYGFRRLVEALLPVLPPEAEVLWQVGSTDVSDLGLAGHVSLPAEELFAHMQAADVVVAHAGVGSSLMAMHAGRHPVLVARRSDRGEHVDDHQSLFAAALARRGLATVVTPEELGRELLVDAAARVTTSPDDAPAFVLGAN